MRPIVGLLLLLVACSSPSVSESEPSPSAAPASAYSDAEQAALIIDRIELLLDNSSQTEWSELFDAYGDLTVVRGWALVTTTLTTADLGRQSRHAAPSLALPMIPAANESGLPASRSTVPMGNG
jgi:hypothetical protein